MIDFGSGFDFDKMWLELGKYQRFADSDGHGGSWRQMCDLRTQESALHASLEASKSWLWISRKEPKLIAMAAATWAAAYASGLSEKAIQLIKQAIKEQGDVPS